MDINKITVIGGIGKDGQPEKVKRFDLKMGDIISIVGPTGCGKTTLINDIELFANNNTPSQRSILINDEPIPDDFSFDPSKLTGEAIIRETAMTELSGGQTRSLLIADAVIIGNSPIILLDEIENAGIHRTKALKLLKKYEKIFVFVTHDPRIALLSDFRIIMSHGAMQKMITTNAEEKMAAIGLKKIDDVMLEFRKLIRAGEEITDHVFSEQIKDLAMSYQIYLKRRKSVK